MRPAAMAAAALALATTVAGAATVRHEAGWWVIDAGTRLQAAQQLAALSGTQLSLPPGGVLQRPLRHAWRGRVLAEAWRHVLDDGASFGLHCEGPGRCRVWLLASGAAQTAAARPPARRADDFQLPDPPGLFPSE